MYEFQNILAMYILYPMQPVIDIFVLCYTDIYGLHKRNSVFGKIILAAYKQFKMWLSYVNYKFSDLLYVSHYFIFEAYHLGQNHYEILFFIYKT
jgi:hypothetical protein